MKNEEKTNNLSELVEEQAYIVKRCAENLSALAEGFYSRYGESASNSIEAIATLLNITYDTLLNDIWPSVCELTHSE